MWSRRVIASVASEHYDERQAGRRGGRRGSTRTPAQGPGLKGAARCRPYLPPWDWTQRGPPNSLEANTGTSSRQHSKDHCTRNSFTVLHPRTSGVLALQKLTEQGRQRINELAQRYGVSTDAVMALLQALVNGNKTMAQFNHPELGGSGQWLQGGMTMVGDMFNHGLKAKVDGLCTELSQVLGQQPFVPFPLSSQSQSPGGQQQQQQGGYGSLGRSWEIPLHQGGQQQLQQGGYGSPGMVGGGPAVSLFVPAAPGSSGNWWPADLGFPSGTGSQNNIRYAYFANARRLAVEINGRVTVYDTLDHQIGG